MSAAPPSPSSDFYGIVGISKKAYKSLFTKRNHQQPSPKTTQNHDHNEDTNRSHDDFPSTTSEGFILRSMDDIGVMKRRTSLLSRTGSRRSHTPQARPTYLSSRSTTAPELSKTGSTMKTRGSLEEIMMGPSPPTSRGGSPAKGVMGRSMSRRNGTPIVFSQSVARRKPVPTERKLECTLEELCHGGVKKVMITKDVINEDGMITQEEETVRINIKPGWKKGTKIKLEGKGNQKPGYLPADIVFVVEEKRHALFKRRGSSDLEIAVEVPLLKALTGCKLSVPLMGGSTMGLSVHDVVCPGYEKVIKGQGMPLTGEENDVVGEGRKRGDLRIAFLVRFPDELRDDQRSMACDVLKDCSWL